MISKQNDLIQNDLINTFNSTPTAPDWNNNKITRFMVEQAIARAEGKKHIGINVRALLKADQQMQHKSLKSFIASYNRFK